MKTNLNFKNKGFQIKAGLFKKKSKSQELTLLLPKLYSYPTIQSLGKM